MLFKILSNVSGLSKLVARYSTDQMANKMSISGQNIQVGMVRYRRCVSFRADASGLFLEIKVPLWKPRKILIPWRELRQTGYTKIYWETAVSFVVGDDNLATMAVPMQMFYFMEPFLKDG